MVWDECGQLIVCLLAHGNGISRVHGSHLGRPPPAGVLALFTSHADKRRVVPGTILPPLAFHLVGQLISFFQVEFKCEVVLAEHLQDLAVAVEVGRSGDLDPLPCFQLRVDPPSTHVQVAEFEVGDGHDGRSRVHTRANDPSLLAFPEEKQEEESAAEAAAAAA